MPLDVGAIKAFGTAGYHLPSDVDVLGGGDARDVGKAEGNEDVTAELAGRGGGCDSETVEDDGGEGTLLGALCADVDHMGWDGHKDCEGHERVGDDEDCGGRDECEGRDDCEGDCEGRDDCEDQEDRDGQDCCDQSEE